MSDFDDFLAGEIGQIGRNGRENPSNPVLPPHWPIGSNPQLDKESRLSRLLWVPDADHYATAERQAIQHEGNEISDLPDKPILSLAEQAALVLDGYNGGIGQLASDLRTVAHNFVLADYVEHGIMPAESPQTPLAENTTTMIPDRGWDDIAGFDGVPDLTAEQHGAILHRLMNPAQSTTDATPAPTMHPEPSTGPYGAGVITEHPDGSMTIRYLPAMETTRPPVPPPTPVTVTCGSCAEFEPGKTPLGIGRCSRTANGLPPVASRGYGACFPTAPRSCPDYKELT